MKATPTSRYGGPHEPAMRYLIIANQLVSFQAIRSMPRAITPIKNDAAGGKEAIIAPHSKAGHLAVDAIEQIVRLDLDQRTLAGAEPSSLLLVLPRASVGSSLTSPAAGAIPRDAAYAVRPCRGCGDLRDVVPPQRVPRNWS